MKPVSSNLNLKRRKNSEQISPLSNQMLAHAECAVSKALTFLFFLYAFLGNLL